MSRENTTTPTNQELQRTLAAMMPDVLCLNFAKDGYVWKEDWVSVRDTELEHLVRLAESRLTDEQYGSYAKSLLNNAQEQGKTNCERGRLTISATWQQRVITLSRVHQPAGREEGV